MSCPIHRFDVRGDLRPVGSRDGVLDRSRELIGQALIFRQNWSSYPSTILPKRPAHSPGRTPKDWFTAPFCLQKRIQNLIGFLTAFWLQKWTQKPAKMEPKWTPNASFFRLRFHVVFSIVFGRLFARFPRGPTLDLHAIYNGFVGSNFFR